MPVLECEVRDPETGMRGFLVIDSLQQGSRACSGVRVVPECSREEVRLIARSMTNKYAFFGVSKSGGAKAALCVPENASPEERKRMLASFGRAIAPELRSRRYIPWTDMGSTPDDVRAILAAAGAPQYALADSATPTAWSALGCMRAVAEHIGLRPQDCTVAIEGFGAIGGALARELAQCGFRIVAVSTRHGALFCEQGLPVAELLALRERHGSAFVRHAPFARLSCDELLGLPVTFLVPGARAQRITAETRMRARAIVPVANAPYAEGALEGRDCIALPDFLCNAGGYIGSRLVVYGCSNEEARVIIIEEFRELARSALALSAACGIAPGALVECSLLLRMLALRRASFASRAYEHFLRASWIPRAVRKKLGVAYVRARMADVCALLKRASDYVGPPARAAAPYVIVTPARDEEARIGHTIRSVIAQAHRPARWIIVDDGSTDATASIVERFAQEHPWIELVRLPDRGERLLGKGVVDAFNAGYARVDVPHEFVVKLDADMALPPHFFARLLAHFARDARLGIASGVFETIERGAFRKQRCHAWYVPGHCKVYRKECYASLGGLDACLGWDVIDVAKARLRGWMTRSFADVRGIHLRPMSSSTGAWWRGREREGRAAYWLGARPLYALARGVRMLAARPYVSGGLGFLKGYAVACLKNAPRYGRKEVLRWVRGQQLKRMKLA